MDSICYCCNITFMQALLYSCGCGGHERGVWLRIFLLLNINAWSWRKWCHFWCEWVHEGTNWPLPSFFALCPLFFSALCFETFHWKPTCPGAWAGPTNLNVVRREKMQWIFRQMTICYWFLVPAAPSLGFQFLEVIMHWFFGLANINTNFLKKYTPVLRAGRGGQEKGRVPGMEK